MIVTRLSGGLGNQMFQYALGRSLAQKENTSLKLDLFWLVGDKQRTFSLDCFNITGSILSGPKALFLPSSQPSKRALFLNKIRQAVLPYRIIKENASVFDPQVLAAPDNSVLDGYWQSEDYFKEIEDIIRQEFTFKTPLEGRNLEIAKKIQNSESVSVHIRRGDYVTNSKVNTIFGICSPQYYQDAVTYISGKISNPELFVFSDDPEWVKENLTFQYPTIYVDFNSGTKSYEDMRLMSLCQHHITANSSFSWWGAWLGNNSNKIVIAPSAWFSDKSFENEKLIPSTWIRI